MAEHTIPEVFHDTVARNPEKVALRYKEGGVYKDITYSQFKERAHYSALGLISLGMEFQDRMAIRSRNRPEWVIADQAILWLGGINVPMIILAIAGLVLLITARKR